MHLRILKGRASEWSFSELVRGLYALGNAGGISYAGGFRCKADGLFWLILRGVISVRHCAKVHAKFRPDECDLYRNADIPSRKRRAVLVNG